jgi:hypothetical protein
MESDCDLLVLCTALWQRLYEWEQRMDCCNVWCSCLLTVCSVLQTVHCNVWCSCVLTVCSDLQTVHSNAWCSCVLTVCSVLQKVHSSKVMLAAEQKVTCTVHSQLWARLWHRVASTLNMSVTHAGATYCRQQAVWYLYLYVGDFLGYFGSKTQYYTQTTRVRPSVRPFVLFVEVLWMYLYQNCPTSWSFMQICCCNTLLKDVNDFPTRTVHISWHILEKFGTRELNTITLRCFPENRAVKDTIYVGN